ncbi:TPA: RHS repeat protein, partial [Escherichia coli]|nr:RHS repeat protein [Escherichia coli]
YEPGSFTPLLRIETENGEQAKARHRSLAEVLQEDTGVTLPAELAVMLGRLERELRAGAVSAESEAWLAQCGLTAEQMKNQMEAEYIPERKLHLYHCDHRGLPQALISPEGETAWQGEYDEWGNLLGEESAQNLQQSLRLPGQQYDEESGLYYNRHRYYDPLQGRYITQDPIGLAGGWNLYKYPLNPVQRIDPMGLDEMDEGDIFSEYDNPGADSLAFYMDDHGASPEEITAAVNAYTRGVGGWNPGAEYVMGLSIAPAVIAGVVFSGPVSSAAALEGGALTWGEMALGSLSSCGAVATTDYMSDHKMPDKSELALCALGGAFGAGKTFIEKIALKMGLSFLSKGGDFKSGVNAAANTGVEEVAGAALGALPFVPKNAFGDYVTDMTSSEAVDKLKGDDKKDADKK